MRRPFDPQLRFDCPGIPDVRLNTECRDEIIAILRALQHIYTRPELRNELLNAVARDVNGTTRADQGRPGMDYWSILVLGAVRLGCDLDYDRLQNLAEEHRSLRRIMGIDGWCDDQTFDWRCLRDNICLLSPDTIERLNDLILARATALLDPAWFPISPGPATRTIERLRTQLLDFVDLTVRACDQARRRVLAEESVPHDEKLFSLFEPQTQLIKRGKVPQPIEFGHRVLVIEDGAGFVCHYAILPHGAEDREVLVGEMKQVQQRLDGRIRSASFD